MLRPVQLGIAFLAGAVPFLAQDPNTKTIAQTTQVAKSENDPTKISSPKDFYIFTHDKSKQKIKMELASEKAIENCYKQNNLDTFKDHLDQLKMNIWRYNLSTSHLKKHVLLQPKDKRNEVIPEDKEDKNVWLGWNPKFDEWSTKGISFLESEPINDPPGVCIDRAQRRTYVDLDSLAIRKYGGKDVLSIKVKVDIFDDTGKKRIPAAKDMVFVIPSDFNLVITKGDTAYIVPQKIKDGTYDVKFDPRVLPRKERK